MYKGFLYQSGYHSVPRGLTQTGTALAITYPTVGNDYSLKKDSFLSSPLKDAKEGASATGAGSEFQVGIIRWKKMNLKQLVLAGICGNFSE